MVRFVVRASLWLLLPLALALAVETAGVSLLFLFEFTADRPFMIALALAEVSFPVFIAYALLSTRIRQPTYLSPGSSNANHQTRLYICAAIAWTFVVFLIFLQWWQPWLHGGPWGW